MIGKLAKAVLKLLLPDVTEHLLKVFKLEKVLAYVELPNEADLGVKKLTNEMSLVKEGLKDLEKVKAELDKLKNIRRL